MTEKRFKLKDYGYDGWAVEDTTGEIFENDYIEDMSEQQVVDTLNELHEENKQLKQALLFFLDIANAECSSNFKKDMEHDCQKLFNCSYDEAKKKYGGYKCTNEEYENLDTIDNQLFCDLYFNQVGGI